MLGLKHGTVRIVPYDPLWVQAFVEARALLADALIALSCEIEHIGSTSVPGLVSKPILDIAVGVPPDGKTEAALWAIRCLGYEYRGDAGADGGHILVRESALLVRTHHVHVVESGGEQWRSYLLLRDLLRRDARSRTAYGEEKLVLAQRHPEDRSAYTAAKSEVVRRLLLEARRPAERRS